MPRRKTENHYFTSVETKLRAAALRLQPKTWPMTWLVATGAEARTLVNGRVPSRIRRQAKNAVAGTRWQT